MGAPLIAQRDLNGEIATIVVLPSTTDGRTYTLNKVVTISGPIDPTP